MFHKNFHKKGEVIMARHKTRGRHKNKYTVIVANLPVMVFFTYMNINNILKKRQYYNCHIIYN